MSSRFFALLAAAALAMPAAAQAKDSDVVMHQRDAGTLDAAGFARAVTMSGGMSLDMPCKFAEMSFKDSTNSEGNQHFASSGTLLLCMNFEKLSTFAIVLRSGYNTGAVGADHFFEQQFADDSKAGVAERLDYNGDRAFTSLVKEGDRCKWKIAVRHGADLISLNYVATASDCRTTKDAAVRFMSSLEFQK